ncbi:hypothetical protein FROZEN_66 [Erwinia phage vB_EamP_Frozen]|uniref:Uncharacterized protein n=4 Tax=Johnsonvirus TaxID=1982576 RepID=W6B133_9CAUD|nr:hypothetical protein Ea92_64A [Erwinia phage Ea9-2]YP_009286195.1 hypothetical protein FROZEN_66 [Erwinia phage vB_EamP_Frozen]ANJ65294.1 hypothetical protein REXELLA_66 [Erwinia phage vB_EamP_Rexella]ASB43090.1 hypothetical protein GUTMEISTER_58 [Erwinia phage vB_EamP_Gutmeister]AHI60124.1 hypothetical protein Ea92_64A [Erwinia phage Ea9-2]ANJ65195.1 hypothetical protein FROZEN_66 [Erwinia phage vB_EamP_Frozen]
MRILIYGILTVAVVLAITSAIVSIAPYVAIIIVIALIGWFVDRPPK